MGAGSISESWNTRQDYDYMEQYGNVDMKEAIKCGTCSADYGKDVCGAFTLSDGASVFL